MKRRSFISHAANAALAMPFAVHALPGVASSLKENKPDSMVCIFSKHLEWLDYKDMAKMAKELGFGGIDLTVRPGGHVLPEKVKTDLPKAVKAIHDEGLEIPLITTRILEADDPLTHDILSRVC